MKRAIARILPLLAVAAFQSADAQTILTTGGSQCGGDPFAGCFNASLSLTGGNTFSLTLTNTGAGVFTQIGVGSLSTSSSETVPSFTFTQVGNVGAPAGTAFGNVVVINPNGLSGAGIDRPIIGIDAAGNNGLAVGGTATFSFMITGGTFDISDVQIAVHQQGGAVNATCGGSTKIVFERNNPNTTAGTMNNSGNALCDTPPGGGGTGNVVPEPSTYVLLGSGLLGIFGIAARRRRNAV